MKFLHRLWSGDRTGSEPQRPFNRNKPSLTWSERVRWRAEEEKRSSLMLLRLHCSSTVSSVEPRWPLTCWVKIKNVPKGKTQASSTWDGLLLKRFYCRMWGNFSWDGERPGKRPVWRRREASPCHANPARMQRVGGVRLQAALNTHSTGNISLYLEFGQFPCLHERQ